MKLENPTNGDFCFGAMASPQKWINDLYRSIYGRLTTFPLSCPIAPDDLEEPEEVRQLVLNRYRVLFTVSGETVLVLHVTGPFTDPDPPHEYGATE